MMTLLPASTGDGERGSALIEFLLSTLVWVPLLIGLAGIGTELIREIQVTQVCRDAAHMQAYGVDFSQSSNQALLVKAGANLGLTQSGGNGAVVLSTIRMIATTDCVAGGLTADTQHCVNLGQAVFSQRIIIGDSTFQSAFLSPGAPGTDQSGSVSQTAMLTSSADRAAGFTAVLPMVPGQIAYVGETSVRNTDLAWTGLGGGTITSLSIF